MGCFVCKAIVGCSTWGNLDFFHISMGLWGDQDAMAMLLILFQNRQIAFPPIFWSNEPKWLFTFAALYRSCPHIVPGKLQWWRKVWCGMAGLGEDSVQKDIHTYHDSFLPWGNSVFVQDCWDAGGMEREKEAWTSELDLFKENFSAVTLVGLRIQHAGGEP